MRAEPLGGGPYVAAYFGAALAARAFGQLSTPEEVSLRAGIYLYELASLLYCVGFAYAILSASTARFPIWMHLGAIGLLTGALLHGLAGNTLIRLSLFIAGAALMMLVFARAASHSGHAFLRIALLVAATGPGLFALHTVAFAHGDEILQARLLRLGATAALALPLLALLYRFRPLEYNNRATSLARLLTATGMVAVPLVLVLSACVDTRLRYALGPASDCFTVALIIACFQAWRAKDAPALAGFGAVLGSMLLGKFMGFYAFDGPLSAPALVTSYTDAWRVSLRHFHIDAMVFGYTLLLWPDLVRPATIAVAGVALLTGLSMPAMGAWSQWASVATLFWLIVFLWRRTGA